MQNVVLKLDLVHPQPFRLLKMIQNEEDMVVEIKRGQYSITSLIHILRFNTFIFFMAFICCSFTFGVQIVNVNFNMMHL